MNIIIKTKPNAKPQSYHSLTIGDMFIWFDAPGDGFMMKTELGHVYLNSGKERETYGTIIRTEVLVSDITYKY